MSFSTNFHSAFNIAPKTTFYPISIAICDNEGEHGVFRERHDTSNKHKNSTRRNSLMRICSRRKEACNYKVTTNENERLIGVGVSMMCGANDVNESEKIYFLHF